MDSEAYIETYELSSGNTRAVLTEEFEEYSLSEDIAYLFDLIEIKERNLEHAAHKTSFTEEAIQKACEFYSEKENYFDRLQDTAESRIEETAPYLPHIKNYNDGKLATLETIFEDLTRDMNRGEIIEEANYLPVASNPGKTGSEGLLLEFRTEEIEGMIKGIMENSDLRLSYKTGDNEWSLIAENTGLTRMGTVLNLALEDILETGTEKKQKPR